MSRRAYWSCWVFLAIAYMIMVALTWVHSAEWISDSRFYLAWSYRYLGYSEQDAAQMTFDYLAGAPGLEICDYCWPEGFQHSFFHGENGAVVAPRMAYPLLSAPFVGLFGPKGMLVVPALALAAGMALLVRLAERFWGAAAGFAAGLMMLASAISIRYAGAAMTDTLALMFNVIGLALVPLAKQARRRDLVWFLIVLVLNLFTRQFAITVAAGVAATWLLVAVRDKQWRNPWLPFATWSIAVTAVLTFLQSIYSAQLFDGDQLSLTQRYAKLATEKFGDPSFASAPRVLGWQMRVDYHYLRDLDLPLMLLIIVAAISIVYRFRSELSALLAGMGVVTVLMAVIIVDQTYFRYFVPLIPLLVLCALALVRDLYRRPWFVWVSSLSVYAFMALNVILLYLPRDDVKVYLSFAVGFVTMAVFVHVTCRRFGQTIATVAGLIFAMTQTWLQPALSSPQAAFSLLAVVLSLGLLPGSNLVIPQRVRVGGLLLLMVAAAVLSWPAITVAAGLLAAWAASAVAQRSVRTEWAPAALAALAAITAAIVTHGLFPSQGAAIWPLLVEASTDRVFILVAMATLPARLLAWRQPFTWLAIAGIAVGYAIFVSAPGRFGLGAFEMVAPVLMMVTAAAVTRYVRADLDQQQPVAPRAEKAHSGLG